MAQSTGRPVVPMKGRKKHLRDDDLFACTFTDGKTYKVSWKDVKNLFVDKPSVWHIKDLTGGDLPVRNVDAVFDMAGNQLSEFAASFTIKSGQEVLVIGSDVRFNNRGQETSCNWNFGDQTDTKNQTMWDDMFCHNWKFNGDIQHINVTEKAFNLQYIFDGCYSFNQPVSHFNAVNVNTVRAAFQCYASTYDNHAMTQDIKWNTANCQTFNLLLNEARNFNGSLELNFSSAVNVSGLCGNANSFVGNGLEKCVPPTSKCVNFQGMFNQCQALAAIQADFSTWDVSGAEKMASMFSSCYPFTNRTIEQWRTPNCLEMNYMFYGCGNAVIDLRGWCVPKIPDKPLNFNAFAGRIIPPVWGTCP